MEVRSTPRYLSTIKFVFSSSNIILYEVNNEKYVNTPTVTRFFNIEGDLQLGLREFSRKT